MSGPGAVQTYTGCNSQSREIPGGICGVRVTEGLAGNTAEECTMADAVENRTGHADMQGGAGRGKEAHGPTGWSSR
jgi:hypothetical protein